MMLRMNKYLLLLLIGLFYGTGCCLAPQAARAQAGSPKKTATKNINWVEAQQLGLQGIAWQGREHTFDRLPAKAKGQVSDKVWQLSQNSAGIQVRFRSNAKTIRVRWKLRFDTNLNHMAATGVKGLDLYVREGKTWRWAAVGRPVKLQNEAALLSGLPGTEKEYLLYLPLYDGVDSVAVGVEAGADLRPVPAGSEKPIIFYGTSILQGACASRPGMAYPAIIGRSLDRETVNLGFSGNGKLDLPLATLLGETDAALYVLDCLPNLEPEQVRSRTEAFVRELRAAKPHTPILLVENISYAHDWISPDLAGKLEEKNRYYRQAYEALKKAGIGNLHYLDSSKLVPADREGAVDGVHLTDYGFMHLAREVEKKIKKIGY
ncbi:MAG: SGNH/GDSL hydrolase family protein [Adhaeribacter sp.]